MGKKLFAGSLAFSTTDESLQALFDSLGTVISAQVVVDRGSGRSRGFGFVEMSSEEEATAAIEALDGTTLDGRTIRVSVAHAKPDRGRGGRGGGDRGDRGDRGGGRGHRDRY